MISPQIIIIIVKQFMLPEHPKFSRMSYDSYRTETQAIDSSYLLHFFVLNVISYHSYVSHTSYIGLFIDESSVGLVPWWCTLLVPLFMGFEVYLTFHYHNFMQF